MARQQVSGGGLAWRRSNDSQASELGEVVLAQSVGERVEGPQIRR
jgi:hypothetical protein